MDSAPTSSRSDLSFFEALQGGRHATISPETLEMLGKEAANRFLEQGVALNDGIAKLAGSHPDISPEQIRRVAEFANTAVYLAKHDQSKTAGAGSSYPQFELADPARIIQDLNDGATPTRLTPTDLAYSRLSHKGMYEKTASVRASSRDRAEEAFYAQFAVEKVAQDYTTDTVVEEIYTLKDGLESARSHLLAKGEELDLMQKQAYAEYRETVKRHLLDGGSFTDVVKAASATGFEGGRIASFLGGLGEELIGEGVALGAPDLTKVAHRVVNPEHPLVRLCGQVLEFDGEIEKVAEAVTGLEEQLTEVRGFIRENFLRVR